MQIKATFSNWKPLTLAVTLTTAVSPNLLLYSNVDSFISNHTTSTYIQNIDCVEDDYTSNKIRFQNNLIKWNKETMFLSSVPAIIGNKYFQDIVKMGRVAVPFIIEELEARPSTIVWALNLIYRQKITNNPDATITEACKLWVKILKR